MSYFLAYAVSEDKPPIDGDDVASTTGWFNWGTWILQHHQQFPEAAHLAQEGWLDEGVPGSIGRLEDELREVIHAQDDPNLRSISSMLLAGVRARPEEAIGIIVTDGEPGGEEEEPEDN